MNEEERATLQALRDQVKRLRQMLEIQEMKNAEENGNLRVEIDPSAFKEVTDKSRMAEG